MSTLRALLCSPSIPCGAPPLATEPVAALPVKEAAVADLCRAATRWPWSAAEPAQLLRQ